MGKKVRMSPQWIEKVKGFEGLRLSAYKCPGGYATIGYGRLWHKGMPTTITKSEADAYLLEDLSTAEIATELLEEKAGKFTQGQWDALTDFVYNCGGNALINSTLGRTIIKDKESADVGRCLDMWCHSNGKKLLGLVRRRQAEKARYYEK